VEGAAELRVDDGTPLAALPTPFLLRIAVGFYNQEDVAVGSVTPLHGNGTGDGRYMLAFTHATRYAHAPGEVMRHVRPHEVLRTRFDVVAGSRPAAASAAAAAAAATAAAAAASAVGSSPESTGAAAAAAAAAAATATAAATAAAVIGGVSVAVAVAVPVVLEVLAP